MNDRINYVVEKHPFGTHIPENAKYMIIGTFPTHRKNFTFNFFYSGKDNLFWKILQNIFDHSFQYIDGEKAVEERKLFLTRNKIAMADMHEKCYRKNGYSTDENLFPIILTDIFSLLDEHPSIERLILTSRTEIFGSLGLLTTYFLQKNQEPIKITKKADKILRGTFFRNEKEIEVIVPYSPSPRLINEGRVTFTEIVSMYKKCFS